MPTCSTCKKIYEKSKGLSYVLKDGTVYHFCSSKCRKNKFMKRRKLRWVYDPKKTKQKK